jgi:hypothetical protein
LGNPPRPHFVQYVSTPNYYDSASADGGRYGAEFDMCLFQKKTTVFLVVFHTNRALLENSLDVKNLGKFESARCARSKNEASEVWSLAPTRFNCFKPACARANTAYNYWHSSSNIKPIPLAKLTTNEARGVPHLHICMHVECVSACEP